MEVKFNTDGQLMGVSGASGALYIYLTRLQGAAKELPHPSSKTLVFGCMCAKKGAFEAMMIQTAYFLIGRR